MAETTRKTSLILIAVLAFAIMAMMICTNRAQAATPAKTMPPLPPGLVEMSIGSPKAPVTVVEYASLTCHFCRAFAMERLPELKKKYIDTGEIRLIYRDFPLDGYALRASMIARCAGADKYFDYVHAYFEQQPDWVKDDPMVGLRQVAKSQGMTDSDIDTCLANRPLSQKITALMLTGREALDIGGTPTFLIDGITVSGALPMEQFEALFDTALIDAGAIKRNTGATAK